jgi:hypothetical protein
MNIIKGIHPLARAVGIFGVVAALVGGATLAVSDTAALTGNDISSATANLLVNNTENGGSPGETDTGFNFASLVPGDDYSDPLGFTLFNDGDADLDITVYATVGTTTGIIDKSQVHFKFVNTDATEEAVYTLAQLETLFNKAPGVSSIFTDTTLAPAEEDHFTVQAKMDAGAVSGTGASVEDFDLVFTGTAVPAPAP